MNLNRLEAAYDEAVRELLVRERCFDRWVKEGKLARTDAKDRLARQRDLVYVSAQAMRSAMIALELDPGPEPVEPGAVTRTGDLPTPALAAVQ